MPPALQARRVFREVIQLPHTDGCLNIGNNQGFLWQRIEKEDYEAHRNPENGKASQAPVPEIPVGHSHLPEEERAQFSQENY